MAVEELRGVATAEVLGAVGETAYARAEELVARRAVVRLRWSEARRELTGTVRGSQGARYATRARFAEPADGAPPAYVGGECSCPVDGDCKHVAALVLTAISAAHQIPAEARDPSERSAGDQPWERALGALLTPARGGGATPTRTPLAIELSVTDQARRRSASDPPELRAQLLKPDGDGWTTGDLSWSSLRNQTRDHLVEHLQLLSEIYALYRSRGRAGYHGFGNERTIDLASFESPRLWQLLAEADRIGIALVHRNRALGTVRRDDEVELCLDVTGGDQLGGQIVSAVLRGDGLPTGAVPFGFIGSEGHGVFYAIDPPPSAEPRDLRLGLAPLTRPASAQLRRMVLAGERLEVPGEESDRFREEYYPRLRNLATVVSSDGSFVPPEISPPRLVLTATYADDHALELGWSWRYQVDDAWLEEPFAGDRDGSAAEIDYRDRAAERDVLAALDDLPGLVPGEDTAYAGVDTMRFTTEVLPLLTDRPDLDVEIVGDPVDYREVSDSVRIGVSTAEIPGETDWFDLGVTITVDGLDVPFADVFAALSHGRSELLLDDGRYFCLDKPELHALRRLIEEAWALNPTDRPADGLRINRFQADLWAELSALGVVTGQAETWRRHVGGLLALDTVAAPDPPVGLTARLRPYQLEGFGWLAFCWNARLGGVLADDMGLGKTLQALAMICHAKAVDPEVAPFLVVAPTSVVPGWAAEAARFAPGLKVVTVTDTGRKRGSGLAEVIAGADVVVTSYTLLRMEVDDYAERPWSVMFMDEGQYAKNPQSQTYHSLRRIRADVKIAITGTPMENNLMELWSLLSITAPGLFPNQARFRDYYAKPVEQGDRERLARLRRRIRPLMLRRTKEMVATDLPAKQEQVVEVELDPRHREIYQTQLQRERQKVLGLLGDLNGNRFTILRSLTLLRRLSLHAGLIEDEHRSVPSAKLDALLEQVREVAEGGHRALVFSQFTSFLAQARERLDEAGVDYCYLDGGTRDRKEVLARFSSGTAPVFLISLKAGGFGLNLTEADYCVLLDPWWNPATEAQAVDRAHRIGQTRNVMVYRFVAKDTIEEKVMAMKERKAELFSSVMDDGDVFARALDATDIQALLGEG